MPSEKSVIKLYNFLQFGIPVEKTKVAACNIDEMPPSMETLERFRYDHGSFGRFHGDAKTSYPFMSALGAFDGFERKFDLTYIRNPDFIRDWEYVFREALEWTASDGGVMVTLVRENDVRKYQGLLSALKNQFNIEPVFSGETGISCSKSNLDIFSENFHHTIGIFKPARDSK
jgi:hypothetical protein